MDKKVIRAISLGIATVMMTTPMTAFAEELDEAAKNAGGEGSSTSTVSDTVETKSEVATAGEAANEAIDTAASAAITVKGDVALNVKAGEAGLDTDDNDLAQDVIDDAADVENVTSEEGASIADADTAVGNANIQIGVAEDNAGFAAGAAANATDKAQKASDAASGAADIADKAVEDVKEKTNDINNATTIAGANAAYEEAKAVVEQAKTDFEAKKAEYDTVKGEYEAAVKAVAEYEAEYNKAVATAGANADAAAAELEAAKAAAAELESAVAAAKTAVDASAAGAMRIAAAENLNSGDGNTNWRNVDQLFIAIMEEYYLPNAGYKDAKHTTTKIFSGEEHSKNYFAFEYKDENGAVKKAYFNYKLGANSEQEGTISEDKMEIFVKREVEVLGGEYDQYVDADGNVKDIATGLADGSLVAITDGDGNVTYYEKNDVTGSTTLVGNSNITATSTTDVTVSDPTSESYKIDTTTGKLVKEVTANVTTVTYTGTTLTSDKEYATDADRDAAAEIAKTGLTDAAQGKAVTVEETQKTTTTYVATGTYIPTFTKTVTVNNEEVEKGWTVWDEADSKSEAVEHVYDEKLGDKYDDEEKYYIINSSNNMSVTGMTKGKWNDDSDYLVSGSASITYAEVTKKSVSKDTFGAIWDNISSLWTGTDANDKVEAAVKSAIEAAGGIFVKAKWDDWDWNKATVYYVEGVKVNEEIEKDTVAEANSSLSDAALTQAKANGANGVYNVKSTTDEKNTTTYSYKINYYKEASTTTESKVVATETYGSAETLEGQIIQNLNYLNGNLVFEMEDNDDYRAFVDDAKDLTAKYERLLTEAKAADDAVEAAQAKVTELQNAIAEMKGAVNNEQKLADLAAQLADAELALADAQEDYDSLQDLMKEAADALVEVIDVLDGDNPPAEEPVILAEEPVAPVVVTTPVAPVAQPGVGAGAGAGAGVVADAGAGEGTIEIDDEATPLAASIEEVVADEVAEDEGIVIEDEATPLAAIPAEEKANMSWWWLLIIAVLGATGYEMYKKHNEKKAALNNDAE